MGKKGHGEISRNLLHDSVTSFRACLVPHVASCGVGVPNDAQLHSGVVDGDLISSSQRHEFGYVGGMGRARARGGVYINVRRRLLFSGGGVRDGSLLIRVAVFLNHTI